MNQSAVAFLVNGRLIVAPVVRTTTGLGLQVEPIDLGRSPDEADIVDALDLALERSARVVPHPAQSEWKGFFSPFLKAARVRSYKAFMRDARLVEIEAIGNGLKLTAQRNLDSKIGFEPLPDETALLPREDLKGVAAALPRLFALNVLHRPSQA